MSVNGIGVGKFLLYIFGYLPIHCFEQLVCSPVGEAHPIKIRKDLG